MHKEGADCSYWGCTGSRGVEVYLLLWGFFYVSIMIWGKRAALECSTITPPHNLSPSQPHNVLTSRAHTTHIPTHYREAAMLLCSTQTHTTEGNPTHSCPITFLALSQSLLQLQCSVPLRFCLSQLLAQAAHPHLQLFLGEKMG